MWPNLQNRFFIFNCCDKCVFCEGICDAQNVFVLTSGGQHGAEEVRMDADVGLVGRRQRLQQWWLVCGRFSLLTAETGFGVSKDV